VISRRERVSMGELISRGRNLPIPRDFKTSLNQEGISIIAEVKRASPSAGSIAERIVPSRQAAAYEAGGAAVISVLTESSYFGGSLSYLNQVKDTVTIPVLRKDFIIDEYQIHESRAAGADALLLISELLDPAQLKEYLILTRELGMSALVEAHGEQAMDRALESGAKIVGINNRDLLTLEVDIKTAIGLLPRLGPDIVKVAESGIKTREEVKDMERTGADAVLIGEALMRSEDPQVLLRELRGEDK